MGVAERMMDEMEEVAGECNYICMVDCEDGMAFTFKGEKENLGHYLLAAMEDNSTFAASLLWASTAYQVKNN